MRYTQKKDIYKKKTYIKWEYIWERDIYGDETNIEKEHI